MAPVEKAPLRHIPNVDILGAPSLRAFVNRKSLLDCAVSSSLRAMNVSYASLLGLESCYHLVGWGLITN